MADQNRKQVVNISECLLPANVREGQPWVPLQARQKKLANEEGVLRWTVAQHLLLEAHQMSVDQLLTKLDLLIITN